MCGGIFVSVLIHLPISLTILRNFGILIGYIVFFTCAYILVAEYIVPDKPRGEVLLFQRGHRQVTHEKPQRDEESATEPRHVGEESINSPPPYSKEARQINLQKQSGVLHWKDVCYEVSIKGQPRLISDHIDGWVRPGTLTALMVGLCILWLLSESVQWLIEHAGSLRRWKNNSSRCARE
jgi:hypothetical protein